MDLAPYPPVYCPILDNVGMALRVEHHFLALDLRRALVLLMIRLHGRNNNRLDSVVDEDNGDKYNKISHISFLSPVHAARLQPHGQTPPANDPEQHGAALAGAWLLRAITEVVRERLTITSFCYCNTGAHFLMSEVPHPGHYHGNAMLIRGLYDLFVLQ